MPCARANGIRIEYDTFGDPSSPPLLLVMGRSAQMICWDEEFCSGLVGHGLFVIRFDNRDVGKSTKFESAGVPDIMAAMAAMRRGEKVRGRTRSTIWRTPPPACSPPWGSRRPMFAVGIRDRAGRRHTSPVARLELDPDLRDHGQPDPSAAESGGAGQLPRTRTIGTGGVYRVLHAIREDDRGGWIRTRRAVGPGPGSAQL